tara:strand:- start:45 stop:404 length:360 start_codon:yes stop_codon:yes gene_type:complete
MRDNMLYFASAAVEGTAGDEECVMVPASGISHFESKNTTTIDVFFKKDVAQEVLGGDGDDQNKATLTITANKNKVVLEAIAGAINANMSSGFVVIADGENSVFVHPDITACALAVVDAS